MLLEKIQEDLKTAMKNRNEKELSAIRMLVAAVKNEEIFKRPKALEEADVIAVVKREIKKLKDAVEQFTAGPVRSRPAEGAATTATGRSASNGAGGRADLTAQYEEEMKILGKYLPAEITEEEVRRVVKSVAEKAIDRNFGVVMKAAMAELKGKSDGALVSKIVKEEIG